MSYRSSTVEDSARKRGSLAFSVVVHAVFFLALLANHVDQKLVRVSRPVPSASTEVVFVRLEERPVAPAKPAVMIPQAKKQKPRPKEKAKPTAKPDEPRQPDKPVLSMTAEESSPSIDLTILSVKSLNVFDFISLARTMRASGAEPTGASVLSVTLDRSGKVVDCVPVDGRSDIGVKLFCNAVLTMVFAVNSTDDEEGQIRIEMKAQWSWRAGTIELDDGVRTVSSDGKSIFIRDNEKKAGPDSTTLPEERISPSPNQ